MIDRVMGSWVHRSVCKQNTHVSGQYTNFHVAAIIPHTRFQRVKPIINLLITFAFIYPSQLSFMWYATFTILATVVVAIPCSEIYRFLYPEERDKTIDPLLLVTFLR